MINTEKDFRSVTRNINATLYLIGKGLRLLEESVRILSSYYSLNQRFVILRNRKFVPANVSGISYGRQHAAVAGIEET